MKNNNDEEKKSQDVPFVIISQEWIDRWLPILTDTELKVYLRLAYHYNHKTRLSFPGQQRIKDAIGISSRAPISKALNKLDELDLIEIMKKPSVKGMKGWPSNKYRMLHVDEKGYHRVERQQSSYKEATEEYKACTEFLAGLHYRYNNEIDALPDAFRLFPDFEKACKEHEWDKKEGFWLFEALGIFLITNIGPKYPDIESGLREIGFSISRESFREWSRKEDAIKKDMKAQWDRVTEDYGYCRDYIENVYPEYIHIVEEVRRLKAEGENNWDKGFRGLMEKHPDIQDIYYRFNYGVFQELAGKHGVVTGIFRRLFEEISRNEKGELGLEFDFDGYVNRIRLPDIETLITEEEQRLIDLEVEESAYVDEDTGEKVVLTPGFTKAEKRDFQETLKKVKAAKTTAVEALVDGAIEILVGRFLAGQVRIEGSGTYKPDEHFWNKQDDGSYISDINRGYHPYKMGLNDLLRQLTHEINSDTDYIRGDTELRLISFDQEPLVKIPRVTDEEVKAKFEEKKDELQAEKMAEEESANENVG